MRTAESVSPMHPDKICDRISDAILDACLEQDPESRVAIETMGGHGIITITGELTTNAYVDMRSVVQSIAGSKYGVQINVVRQSPEISQGVDTGGAGDQGVMVGYATSETKEMLPLEVVLARDLNRSLFAMWPYDGKTQVTIDGKKIVSVVASFQNVETAKLTKEVKRWLQRQSILGYNTEGVTVYANPAGFWSFGGFDADTGLTGRKLAVDNYGPYIPLGGGCFSGKDPSKVDRSAAYMARKIAVDWVSSHEHCEDATVWLAYAIGYDQPLDATITWRDYDYGCEPRTEKINAGAYDLTPNGIIKTLKLKQPIYEKTARYGHFGNNFIWDRKGVL